ncbi:MAG: MBL fold metallo-hydrolase [Acutalibacteraceae bacterium]
MDGKIFAAEKISEHIYKISELGLVNCFLVVGNERAMLIDCGDGVSYIKEEVKKLTSLPSFLAATHAHADHIGGAREWGKVYLHRKDILIAAYATSFSQRTRFLKKNNALEAYKNAGGKLPFYRPYLTMKPFGDRKVFDLGGVKVEAISTPGHTLGSCIFKVHEDKIILAGDNFIPMLYLHYPYAASLSRWVKSCETLFEEAKGCLIYGGHGKNAVNEEGLLWQYETAKKIISQTKENDSYFKRKVKIVRNEEHQHLLLKYRTDKIL